MSHTYLAHMKRMIVIAEEVAKLLNPDYNYIKISPRAAKIIDELRRNKEGARRGLRLSRG